MLPAPLRSLAWLVYLLCWSAVLVAMFMPQLPVDMEHGSDKVGHLLALFGLAFSGCFAVFPGACEKRYWIWTIVAAIALECLQGALVTARQFSLGDIAANLAGVALAGVTWWWLFRQRVLPARSGS
ncbi:hypothetical protein [Parahaliea aestuarii]|uniref:VanZ family protein n=1 Tax=Parahaliea aestuarii TaxID=1852021 RepID=A0A5C8ZW02_9GAMM|nr:hypothetical protein [Parahaliea aestuarii]TXS91772.1 hypothetical protein FVW59_11515 [Parahaliea aestuarii]